MRIQLVFCLFGCIAAAAPTADFYVATNGNDSWSGTLPAPNAAKTDGPFASVARAQSAVRGLAKTKPVMVMVREGTYYLPLSPTNPGTLHFTAADSGSAGKLVTWQNYPGETPVISGGEPVGAGGLGLTWKNASGSLWQVQLPAKTQPFGYLFYNGARRLRSRVQSANGVGYYMKDGACYSTETKQAVAASECNLGTYLRVAVEIPPTGDNAGCPSVASERDKNRSKCLDRFGYDPKDPIMNWVNLNPQGSVCGGSTNKYPVGDIEVTLIEAWTEEVSRVSCVDTAKHIIYFTGPMAGRSHSYNFRGPILRHRFMVENTRDAFEAARTAGQTGLWFLDRSTSLWTLNYLANAGENPNRDRVVIAQVQPVSPTGGSLIAAADLKYVTFRGLTFEVDNYVPPAEGFITDENSDCTLPEAIDCESCQHVTFDAVTVRRTSSSGIQIASTSGNSGEPASNDAIQNSAFYDIGDCGIRIGHHPNGSDRPANVVQFVRVENNIVSGYSRVFPSGEGISQANGHDVTYSHNDITDGYHAGISICQLGCPSHEANGTNITSEYNHIWNTLQGVTADGGTLYYNVGTSRSGSGAGDKILNNLVHDTTDASIIDRGVPGSGYGGAGIYLDIHSTGFQIENNVVYNVAAEGIFMAEGPNPGETPDTFKNNIFANARTTMFRMFNPWPNGCKDPSPRANVLNNIFTFDQDDSSKFYVVDTCANSCGVEYNRFLNFQGNLYWRADGKFAAYDKAFHVLTKPPADATGCRPVTSPKAVTFLTFSQWQDGRPPNGIPSAMNEDPGGTASVDPGFGHTGKPADYLLSKSPLAGFDHTKTNDTIRHAGRNHPVIAPPPVPHTFPTYHYTSF